MFAHRVYVYWLLIYIEKKKSRMPCRVKKYVSVESRIVLQEVQYYIHWLGLENRDVRNISINNMIIKDKMTYLY